MTLIMHLRQVDLIMSPTTRGAAFEAGSMSDPIEMYLEDLFTVPANLGGPTRHISIPSGYVDSISL